MASAAIPPHDVADLSLAPEGAAQIAWASEQMPVLRRIRERFEQQRPLEGVRIAACLHVTAETANLVLALVAGGAEAALCSANPLSTQDDVAAALVYNHGVEVRAMYGEGLNTYAEHIRALLSGSPQITIDDGADLQVTAHELGGDVLGELIGGTEETTTGLVRLRRLEEQGKLACPVLAVNEARAERALNDRHGTGQSAIDGIVRASHVLLAGQTVVIVGYGWAGLGIAERARGAGAAVIVCEVDPLRGLEARMAGYEVMPALEAAARGDIFVTVTGSRRVLHGEHFERMKDGALLANAGHFDVEIDLDELRSRGHGRPDGPPAGRAVPPRRRPPAEPAGARPRRQPRRRRRPSRGGHGRLVRAAGAQRRGARAAPGRAAGGRAAGAGVDRPRGRAAEARGARRADRRADARSGALPGVLDVEPRAAGRGGPGP